MTALPPLFRAALTRAKLPMPVAEVVFAPPRKFRWDFGWVDERVALEIQGGIWSRGAHGRGTGITRDMEKFSLGATLGWRLLLCTPTELCAPRTLGWIRDALAWEEAA